MLRDCGIRSFRPRAGLDWVGEAELTRSPQRCYNGTMSILEIETEREDDGRWIAEISSLPGVLVYGASRDEAVANEQALALRVLADRLENGEALPRPG